MPYKITHAKDGFYVYDPATKRHFSKHGLTKKQAEAQRVAISLSEHKKTGKPMNAFFV